MVFTSLLEGHDPDYKGGSDFQRLDELKGKEVEGQTIKHWAGTIPRVNNK